MHDTRRTIKSIEYLLKSLGLAPVATEVVEISGDVIEDQVDRLGLDAWGAVNCADDKSVFVEKTIEVYPVTVTAIVGIAKREIQKEVWCVDVYEPDDDLIYYGDDAVPDSTHDYLMAAVQRVVMLIVEWRLREAIVNGPAWFLAGLLPAKPMTLAAIETLLTPKPVSEAKKESLALTGFWDDAD